jgi:hypothetical protein
MENIDITDLIVEGNLGKIISYLNMFKLIGYDSIYFDRYNASIELYKSESKDL